MKLRQNKKIHHDSEKTETDFRQIKARLHRDKPETAYSNKSDPNHHAKMPSNLIPDRI